MNENAQYARADEVMQAISLLVKHAEDHGINMGSYPIESSLKRLALTMLHDDSTTMMARVYGTLSRSIISRR